VNITMPAIDAPITDSPVVGNFAASEAILITHPRPAVRR